MSTDLPKTFDPAQIEARWYAHWEENGLFRPERPDAQPFTIVNPPPNVTGSLHIGHALDNTLQDVVVRYERLRGKDALWVVGTDHAGIATQMVVERELEKRQDKRTNYSREDFVAKVWEWKEESGGTITRQLRRLGCSMDWSREQFTMSPEFTRAVTKVFVDLYNEGLIYRDKRLVNWDPKLKTAISDLEVETQEVKGGFWHFRYPLADGVTTSEGKDHLVVATTRPETMLADMAVAVHPSDARYASVVGKEIVQPITGRRFRVVADEHADPELGSGVVKITPGHDFNDFEVGKRAGIAPGDMLNMLDAEGNVCQIADGLVPQEFLGLHRFRKDGMDGARELVVARMKELGCLIPHVDKDGVEHDAEPRTIATPFGDRGGVVIEPWLTDQWYVDAEKLAQAPIEAVRDGRIEIVPKSWEKTFFNWMENIQPWCVSRQLWWGHRIPAWYGADGEAFVADTENKALELAREHYGPDVAVSLWATEVEKLLDAHANEATVELVSDPSDRTQVFLTRDEDVLDTWFSSALWPFATLGWPETLYQPVRPELVEGPHFSSGAAPEGKNGASTGSARTDLRGSGDNEPATLSSWAQNPNLLAKHYPNDLLISGFDILFFWDARMAMQGMHFLGQAPWKRLYLHGLVRAADGQKMSKSKGNVVDPLLLIDKFGADALRFFMAAMESQGRDVKMDESRVEGYRNFATKLWNATRFCQANGIGASETLAAPQATSAVNRWIVGEVVETVAELDKAMADLRFDAAANAIYHFVWDTFCDWYLELIKGQIDDETRAVAAWVLDQILVMLHPFMPFITEELWHAQGERPYELIVAKWPEPEASVNAAAKAEVEWLIAFIREMRSARSALDVPASAKTEILVLNDLGLDGLRVNQGERYDLIERFRTFGPAIARLTRSDVVQFIMTGTAFKLSTREELDRTKYTTEKKKGFTLVVGGASYHIPLEGVIDFDAANTRLAKALAAAEKEAKSLEGRLSNANFVERAKPEAVEKARADHAHHAAEAERLKAALERLG